LWKRERKSKREKKGKKERDIWEQDEAMKGGTKSMGSNEEAEA